MDTSPKYIAMCGQARDFRKSWEPAVGDWYYQRRKRQVLLIESLPHSRKYCTWLPRVDQVFAIAQAHYDVRFKPVYTINRFHQYLLDATPDSAGTLEQLMLQFMLYEIYRLRFIGGAWILKPDDV